MADEKPQDETVPESEPDNPQLIDPALPTQEKERIKSLDLLRGFALFGILIINIMIFAMPEASLFNPNIGGQFEGLNKFLWYFSHIFAYQKFMTIFSMLFGAGIILFTTRAAEKGHQVGRLFYRRMLWMLLFGMVHGYFLWYGDILFAYAICGMFLFLVRKFKPIPLIAIGVVIFMIGMFTQMGIGYGLGFLKAEAVAAETAFKAGEELTDFQESMMESWYETRRGFSPNPEEVAEEIEKYKGGYWDIFTMRFYKTLVMQTIMLFLYIWRVAGVMLFGMALFKLGVLSAGKSARFYILLGSIGYAIGLTLTIIGVNRVIMHDYDAVQKFLVDANFGYIGGPFMVLGHISVIMLLAKSDIFGWFKRSLAAVGRMAFSNYILHTVVMTTIFYGYGFGQFGQWQRYELFILIIGMWIVQLFLSPWWMNRYYFGPLEWLWRSLTYGQKQPFKRREELVAGSTS